MTKVRNLLIALAVAAAPLTVVAVADTVAPAKADATYLCMVTAETTINATGRCFVQAGGAFQRGRTLITCFSIFTGTRATAGGNWVIGHGSYSFVSCPAGWSKIAGPSARMQVVNVI